MWAHWKSSFFLKNRVQHVKEVTVSGAVFNTSLSQFKIHFLRVDKMAEQKRVNSPTLTNTSKSQLSRKKKHR